MKVPKKSFSIFGDEDLYCLPLLQFAKLPEFSENKEYCEEHSDNSRHGNLVINLREFVNHVGVGIGKMLKIIHCKKDFLKNILTCLIEVNLSPKYLKITIT